MASERLCVPVTTLTVASQSGGCNVTSDTAGPTTLALVLLAIALRKRTRIC
jgi:MYXO-CTERM domain-containing protein